MLEVNHLTVQYPLGGSYHIAHGVSNAMLLAQVMEYNEDACIDGYCQIADTLGVDASLSKRSVPRRSRSVSARSCMRLRSRRIFQLTTSAAMILTA